MFFWTHLFIYVIIVRDNEHWLKKAISLEGPWSDDRRYPKNYDIIILHTVYKQYAVLYVALVSGYPEDSHSN